MPPGGGLVMLVTWIGAVAFVTVLLSALPKSVDARLDLKGAWQLTRGNRLRMMVIAGGLPWALRYASWWLYRDEPTLAEVVLITILGTALIAVEVAALSLAYRALSSQATSGS